MLPLTRRSAPALPTSARIGTSRCAASRLDHASVDLLAAARRGGRCGDAWLFGSFAWGEPRERSDVDVLVSRCDDPDALAAEVWRRLDRPVHVVALEAAPESLVQRVLAEGRRL